MITLEDCIALCGLSEDEILAIAEHEHVPEIVAAGMATSMLQCREGCEEIRDMIVDDIRAARDRGDWRHVRELIACLQHFLQEHPDVIPVYGRGGSAAD